MANGVRHKYTRFLSESPSDDSQFLDSQCAVLDSDLRRNENGVLFGRKEISTFDKK